MAEPIRVFIGSEQKTELARQVLEFSIRRRTKAPVQFTALIGPGWEYPDAGLKVGTKFSLRRWLAAAAVGWRGRLIVMDADILCLADIAELWSEPDRRPQAGCSAWGTYQPDKFSKVPWFQSSVMVVDAAAAAAPGQWGWRIDKVLDHLRKHQDKKAYADFMHATWMTPAPARIDSKYNGLNRYEPGKTCLLHYTSEPQQPWYLPGHPLAGVWEREAVEAVKAGAVDRRLVEEGLRDWGKKVDWRPTNGLHPHWRKLLDYFPRT